jgi:hypothetical protein
MPPTDILKQQRKQNFLVIERDDLAILHPGNTGRFELLVLTLIVSGNLAQVGSRASSDVVRRGGVEADPGGEKKAMLVYGGRRVVSLHDILRLLQFEGGSRALTLEQVAVMSGFLHYDSSDSIALFEDLLGRGPLLDEVGNPRWRARLLVRLAQSVKNIDRGERPDSDVETPLCSSQKSILVTA